MAKVHPQTPNSSSTYLTWRQETFTIWMKSLVLGGKGCTVYDSEGQIIYRVDNYNSNCRKEVCLMDFNGKVLFTVTKKKYSISGCWQLFRSADEDGNEKSVSFQVRKSLRIWRGESAYEVTIGLEKNQPIMYRIENHGTEFACKIVDSFGRLVAEVKRKQSAQGVFLGQDVMSLVVEPGVDHSLAVALLVAFSLINHRM